MTVFDSDKSTLHLEMVALESFWWRTAMIGSTLIDYTISQGNDTIIRRFTREKLEWVMPSFIIEGDISNLNKCLDLTQGLWSVDQHRAYGNVIRLRFEEECDAMAYSLMMT